MLKFLTDENIDPALPEQLRRHLPGLDIIDVREVGLNATPDPIILQWEADHGRVLITRDVSSMRGYAYQRAAAGLPLPGVIITSEDVSFGDTLQGIIRLAAAQFSDIENQVVFAHNIGRGG